MNPIENAAELIQDRIMPNRWPTVAEIAQIIRDELFPPVKPEDVTPGLWYWVRRRPYDWCIAQCWLHDLGSGRDELSFRTHPASQHEIRGPIPMPE
jgi:hypothetical protein